jgi:hypothetical protein
MQRSIYSLLILVFLAAGCYAPSTITTTVPTYPSRSFKTPPQNIVVANAYDVTTASVRENKEKLFAELLNLTVRTTSDEITKRSGIPSVFVDGYSVNSQSDSSVNKLIDDKLATHAIMITKFNSWFEQTHVDVTKNEDGSKNRQAFYDIIVDIGYSLHDVTGYKFDTLISVRRFHSSRGVLSGLLAAGPNIVSNADDAAEGIHANVDMYLKSFFIGSENRVRFLYIAKEFKEMQSALKVMDYQRAFEISERLIANNDQQISAMASYNCAVLLERSGDYDQVKSYLKESLLKYNLPPAREMMFDYRNQ